MKEIKRQKIEEALLAHIDKKEITLLIGPRQVGKTTLMKKLQAQEQAPTLFFNLDIDQDRVHFKSQQVFLSKIMLELGEKTATVFIDEIQRRENAGLFLKGLYDRDLPYKFVVSGSGSLELKEKVVESLAGRKRVFEIPPISFQEFIQYKTANKYDHQLIEYCRLHENIVYQWLEEYLAYGGYPKVVTTEGADEKISVLQEIYNSYIDRDINNIINIEKPQAFENLLRLLAFNNGYFLNYSTFAKKTGLSIPTVKNYIWYLEKTFIVKLVTPYFSNPAKEIIKSPVLYFNDLGMCSLLRRSFRLDPLSNDAAFAFQNLVFHLLRQNSHPALSEIKCWRTKDQAEVDFVIDKYPTPVPVEVKFSNITKPGVSRSMRNFIRQYQPEKAYIINLSYRFVQKFEQTEMVYLPYYELFTS